MRRLVTQPEKMGEMVERVKRWSASRVVDGTVDVRLMRTPDKWDVIFQRRLLNETLGGDRYTSPLLAGKSDNLELEMLRDVEAQSASHVKG